MSRPFMRLVPFAPVGRSRRAARPSSARIATALVCLAIGSGLVGERLWLLAKAQLASVLIERSFTAHLADGAAHLPWGWADTWPVARLEFPRLGVSRTVLRGATGATLAFGPGHVDGTASPGSAGNAGNIVIAGHRDSWFQFLREVDVGDIVQLQSHAGVQRYRVAQLDVRDVQDTATLESIPGTPVLTLVTCYPFDERRQGPLRYVVTCLPLSDRESVS